LVADAAQPVHGLQSFVNEWMQPSAKPVRDGIATPSWGSFQNRSRKSKRESGNCEDGSEKRLLCQMLSCWRVQIPFALRRKNLTPEKWQFKRRCRVICCSWTDCPTLPHTSFRPAFQHPLKRFAARFAVDAGCGSLGRVDSHAEGDECRSEMCWRA
jgi:hypothetical protein